MNLFITYLFDFLIGGSAYCTVEVVYRGRTHFTMFFAGGIILATFCYINAIHQDTPLLLKCIFGALFITMVEFVFGIIFNIMLKMNVWDYSNVPLNILGQICIPFTLIWFVFSFVLFKWVIPNNPLG